MNSKPTHRKRFDPTKKGLVGSLDGGKRKGERKTLAYATFDPMNLKVCCVATQRKGLLETPVTCRCKAEARAGRPYVQVALWPLGVPEVQETLVEVQKSVESVGEAVYDSLKQLSTTATHTKGCLSLLTHTDELANHCDCYLRVVFESMEKLATVNAKFKGEEP